MRQILLDFGFFRIYGYGFMLVMGFLTSIYLAQWRARRAGENPEIYVHVGLLAVVGGIFGARIAYVIQHHEEFTGPLDILNIAGGGLIYYGGLILGTLVVIGYLFYRKVPVRRYLDMVAVSVMVGLAFGRAGCLLNGCCYGADARPGSAVSMSFPMYSKPMLKLDPSPGPYSRAAEGPSPVYEHQFEEGKVHPDARFVYTVLGRDGKMIDRFIPPRDLHGALTNNQVEVMFGSREDARRKFDSLVGSGGLLTETIWRQAVMEHNDGGFLRGSESWQEAVTYDRRQSRGQGGAPALDFDEAWEYLQARKAWLTGLLEGDPDTLASRVNAYLQADLYQLADRSWSRPVKPSQAIGIANALVLAGILALFFRLRRREGQVFALMAILYPITRFVEEMIRDDNAHDLLRGILTHNQYTSLVLLVLGVVFWWSLRWVPASCGPTWSQRLATGDSTSGRQMPKK